jgi:hypothetical protein
VGAESVSRIVGHETSRLSCSDASGGAVRLRLQSGGSRCFRRTSDEESCGLFVSSGGHRLGDSDRCASRLEAPDPTVCLFSNGNWFAIAFVVTATFVFLMANPTLETNADFASQRRHRSAFRWKMNCSNERRALGKLLSSLAALVLVACLCGCSRENMPQGRPDLDVDGFFVCQKCNALSAINGGEPPSVIPVHASVCPTHSWQRISKRDYVRKAAASPVEIRLLPPTLDLTTSTSTGATGIQLYSSAFTLCVGSSRYVVWIRPVWAGGVALLALVALTFGGRWIAKRGHV